PLHTTISSGSERGPVALPVFKTGRSLLTQEGSVRLRGASATSRQSQGAQDDVEVAEIFENDIGAGRSQRVHVVTARGHRHGPCASGRGARDIKWRVADHDCIARRDR